MLLVPSLTIRYGWAVCLALAAISTAQSSVQTPKPGTALRKAVLDGLRPSVEKDLKQKVIFKVDAMRVYKGWAFVHVHPIKPNGKPIDFRKTKYAEALEAGMFDGDSTYALLKQSGSKWVVKEFAIGPTDVVWSNWMGAPHHPPKQIFPPMGE